MAKNYGSSDIMAWSFTPIELPQEWIDHLGDITEGARILVRGRAKNGKTTYVMKLVKVLAEVLGKVNFNSTEQGKTSGFKKSYIMAKLNELPAGKFMLCSPDQKNFDVWFKKIQKNAGKVLVLDSMDYMNLTFEQFKQLNDRFPGKTIIMVCWHNNAVSKKIEYMMDAIVEVKNFQAHVVSREGGGKPYVIRDIKPEPVTTAQTKLF